MNRFAGRTFLLAAVIALAACSGRGITPTPTGAHAQMPAGTNPGSIVPAPMGATTKLPASAMTSRKPAESFEPANWTQQSGIATQVSIGGDGSHYLLSDQPAGPDKFIWQYNGSWTNLGGVASQIAAANGALYAINSGGGIYKYSDGTWTGIAGGASSIAAASDGTIYVTSNGGTGDEAIWHLVGSTWTQMPGAGVAVFSSTDTAAHAGVLPGGVYVLNAAGDIYYLNPDGYTAFNGLASSIAGAAGGGGFFALGATHDPNGEPIYYYDLNTSAWQTFPGSASSVAFDPTTNTLWAVASSGAIYATSADVAAPVSGTASVSLYGALNSAGALIQGTDVHMYSTRFDQAVYGSSSPYVVINNGSTLNMDVYAITIHNTSTTANISEIAFALPAAYDTLGYLSIYNVASSKNAWWMIAQTVRCLDPNVRIDCLQADDRGGSNGANTGIAPGASQTIYLALTAPPHSFDYADWSVQAVAPRSFALTSSGSTTVPISGQIVDSLAQAGYSLDSTLMAASFAPSSATAGSNADETFSATNTATAVDPFPDYVDAVVVAVPTGVTVASPVATTSGWTFLGSDSTNAQAGYTDYWYGVCSAQYVPGAGPPTAAIPLVAAATAVPNCSTAQEANSLAPGSAFNATMTLGALQAGTSTFQMYAHGAIGNGWSTAKSVPLQVTN